MFLIHVHRLYGRTRDVLLSQGRRSQADLLEGRRLVLQPGHVHGRAIAVLRLHGHEAARRAAGIGRVIVRGRWRGRRCHRGRGQQRYPRSLAPMARGIFAHRANSNADLRNWAAADANRHPLIHLQREITPRNYSVFNQWICN